MLNSESEKRSNERLKTLHSRKRKYERLLSNPIKQKERDDSDNTQQDRYRTLIENVPCAIYSAYPGKTGPTTFISKKWEVWTGYSPEELYRDPEAWPKCIHPDDKEKTVNTYLRACQDNIPYNLEYRIVHKETGQVRYVCDQGHLSHDKDSNVARVDGIITDITEINWMGKSLRESEERFRRIFEEGPIGIATSGADFRFTRANA
ncbi:MAG: PAS domain-containing protein, partial [Sedimentisphaerales bacterium]|nr:PAS domain-containing protein [Sedimentisphaerales bacterium]